MCRRGRVVAAVLAGLLACAIAVAEMTCPKCGAKYPDGSKFCPKDGTKLVPAAPKCPKCGKAVPKGAKFCPGCGTAVAVPKEKAEEVGPPASLSARERAVMARCALHLKLVGYAMHLNAGDHGDRFPPTLDDLLGDYITDRDILCCPASPGKPSYGYLAGLTTSSPRTWVLAFDQDGNHGGGRNVLYVGGKIRWVMEDAFRRERDITIREAKAAGLSVQLVAPSGVRGTEAGPSRPPGVKANRNEAVTAARLRAYVAAQSAFHRSDRYAIGRLVYANPVDGTGLKDLHSIRGAKLKLIDRPFADATSRAAPLNGYYFMDMLCDNYTTEFGLCAIPADYPTTGRHTLIINHEAAVYMSDTGGKPIQRWPGNLAGWTTYGVASRTVKGEHISFSDDTLEFKADLALLPDNAFPPAFTCLIGRQLTPEKLVGYLVANLPRDQRAQAMRKALADMKEQPTQEDTDLAFAKMSLENVSDGPLDLRVSVRVARFSEPAATTVRLAKGERKIVRLSPVFSDAVMGLTEERMSNVSIRVEKTGGGVILERTLPLRLLSCNDMVWTAEKPFDCMFLIAVFVTPRDSKKAIDTLMREAVERTPFANKSIVGYQEQVGITYRRIGALRKAERKQLTHREIVEAQAKAIYDTIKARGVKYVHTPISFAAGAQRVKYADEILADRSGNCIETTVLFASAFEAMGMHPIVIVVPGHAFVGVKSWKWGSGPEAAGPPIVIETTMVGSDSYEAARKRADATYARHQRAGDLRMIAIDMMRHLGIPPASR